MSDRVTELVNQAWEMERGPEQLAVLEEAVREADAAGDVQFGYAARMELIEAAVFSGAHERAVVAYSWCLARYDEDPQDVDIFSLFWRYKWILDALPNFATVSRRQIVQLQDDMERRFAGLDYSLRPVHYMRYSNFMRMGDFEAALANFERWKRARRDELADCRACEQEKQVELMARLFRDEEAIEAAQPISAGRMSCTEIPQWTYATVMRPLLRLRRLEEAADNHRAGYRRIAKESLYLLAVGEHLLFLVSTGDMNKAMRLFEHHLPWAIDTANAHARFNFYLASALFLHQLAANGNRQRKFALPSRLPCYREDSNYVPAELAGWFDKQFRKLANEFNERNGNDYYDRYVAQSRELAQSALA